MKNSINKFFICLTLISTIGFTSCSDSEDGLPLELTIEEKVTILESDEWLLKGFEESVMHTFDGAQRLTYYAVNGDFPTEAIPGRQDYTIVGDLFMLDFNFGNTSTYDLKVSCNNNIVEFFKDEELHSTYLRRNSNYQDCL